MNRFHSSLLALVLAPLGLSVTASAQDADARTAQLPKAQRIVETSAMDPAVTELLTRLADAADAAADPAAAAAAHTELALALEANTMWTPALAEYEVVAALLPEKPEWLFRKGVCQQALGDLDGALTTLRAAAGELKGTAVIQGRLGDVCLTLGLVDEAEQAWQAAIDSEAKLTQALRFPQSRVGLAQVRYEQDNLEDAEKLLREALSLNPAYRHAHYLLGLVLAEQGREDEAEFSLQRGVNAWPAFPPDPHRPRLDAYSTGYNRRMMRIENQLQGGDIPGAMAQLAEIRKERPGDRFVLNMIARGLTMQGQLQQAYEVLLESEAADAGAQDTLIELAVNLINQAGMAGQQQQLEAAMELYGKAKEKADRAIEVAPLRGRPYLYRGMVEMALASMNTQDPQAAGQGMQNAKIYFERAHLLGCTEPQLYQQLVQLYAGDPRTHPKMLIMVEKFAEKQPDNPSAWQFVTQARITAGDLDGALEAASRMERLAPLDPNVKTFVQNVKNHVQQQRMTPQQPGGGR